MCFATPYQIKKIVHGWAQIGKNRKVNLILLPKAKIGDWLLVHADLAINILSQKEAGEILALTKNYKFCHSRESGNL